ncbi:hypothetical protein L9F63_010910 [Diploptera punctata]|uniref:Uncharacterized protein n=1 Tax=Diploptera punctata TaxID=6984 RepID=A0AAD8AIH6_DIPPU|nr:hypothetical protein L9F63_010910 [Diploptera punctata]
MRSSYFKCFVLFTLLYEAVISDMICDQDQLGVMVVLHCPPDHSPDLSHCCNDNGKISCCSHEEYLNHTEGTFQSSILLLALTGGVFLAIICAACYIKWYGKHSNDDETEEDESHQNDKRNAHTVQYPPRNVGV